MLVLRTFPELVGRSVQNLVQIGCRSEPISLKRSKVVEKQFFPTIVKACLDPSCEAFLAVETSFGSRQVFDEKG